jgi:hypothetical protein
MGCGMLITNKNKEGDGSSSQTQREMEIKREVNFNVILLHDVPSIAAFLFTFTVVTFFAEKKKFI